MPKPPGRGGAAWVALCKRVRREEPCCRYCGVELLHDVPLGHPDRFTVDHIVPISLAPELALVRANLAGCCHRDNVAKGGRTVEQWRTAEHASRYSSPLPTISL